MNDHVVKRCRSCGGEIIWLWTSNGKRMPVDADSVGCGHQLFDPANGHMTHFATCPNAARHRSPSRRTPKPKPSPKT